jgi:hypothetical protein
MHCISDSSSFPFYLFCSWKMGELTFLRNLNREVKGVVVYMKDMIFFFLQWLYI